MYFLCSLSCIMLIFALYIIQFNMRIINSLSFLLITFLLGYSSVYSQTQADVKMGEILNGGDLFQLRNEYPKLRDSVSIKMH